MSSLRSRIGRPNRGLCAIVTSAFLALNACGSDSFRKAECNELPMEKRPVEVCNGVDDNCDGSVDEGCDWDGDGYCGPLNELVYDKGGPYLLDTCAKTFENCDKFKCEPLLDCDDSNPAINPSAAEYCNGLDDDCDFEVDEYDPRLEDPACGSLDGSLDGVGECKAGLYECISGSLVCSGEALPYAETCNGLDDDCSGFTDDNEASLEFELCFYSKKFENGSWVKVEPCPGWSFGSGVSCDTMYLGICSPGVERCTRACPPSVPDYESCVTGKVGGDNMCYGAILPEDESCDMLDNDCDGIVDNSFDFDGDGYAWCMGDCDDENPLVNPGLEEIACDGLDNDCDGEEAVWIDEDSDLYSPLGGLCGPVDCDDSDALVNPGMVEVCDCIDNDCNGIVDDNLYGTEPIDFIVATDCSGSMYEEIGAIEAYFSSARMPACFSDEIINVSNVIIDSPPYVARSLVTMEVFQDNYVSDVPSAWNCSGLEPTLNVVAYAACLVPGMDSDPICQSISSFNSFIGTQLWRPDSVKHFVLVSDESAQWYNGFPGYNQQQIAQLAARAGMVVDVYTLPFLFSFDTNIGWNQGYGYFSTITGGNLYDLDQEIFNSTLGETFKNAVISWYCE